MKTGVERASTASASSPSQRKKERSAHVDTTSRWRAWNRGNYFYQAYLVEFKTRDSKRRTIAKTCSKTDTPCTYPEFLKHILARDSSNKIFKDADFKAIRTIIETADTTDVITISRRLREKKFDPTYDLSKLLEGTSKSSKFGPVFEKIDGLISYQLASDKVAEHRKPMADALNLIQQHRIANNMKFLSRSSRRS
jgi:hypothetical protein